MTPQNPPAATRIGRVGVVGGGDMARTHLESWHRLGASTAVYSRSGRVAALAPTYRARLVDTLAELLSASDVVDICTPTDTHAAIAAAAIEARRPVIVEKPIALTGAQARTMIAAADAAGVPVFVAHVVRYFAAYAAAHRAVAAGVIGAPASLRLRRTGAAPLADWFHDEARSGGILMDQLIHDFDFARWVAGEVETVQARAEWTGPPHQVSATVTLRHAGGAVSQLIGGWFGAETPFTTELSITGAAGTLTHSNATGALRLERPGLPATEVLAADAVAADLPYDAQLADFASSIADGTEPCVSAADALAALDLTLAARRSAHSGRPEPVRPAR